MFTEHAVKTILSTHSICLIRFFTHIPEVWEYNILIGRSCIVPGLNCFSAKPAALQTQRDAEFNVMA